MNSRLSHAGQLFKLINFNRGEIIYIIINNNKKNNNTIIIIISNYYYNNIIILLIIIILIIINLLKITQHSRIIDILICIY